MKTKMLLSAGLTLLLLILALTCPVISAAQANPPVTVLINGPDYNPTRNIYRGSFSVGNARQVRDLVYVVEDADAGTVAIPDTRVNLGGFDSKPFELDGARLKPERKYLLKVQAVDSSGNLIERSGENYGRSGGEQFILASKEFAHQPPAAPKFEYKINAVNADYAADTLTIMLSVPSGFPVWKYDGFIVDDTGRQVGAIREDLYRGPALVASLPGGIEDATEEHTYKVTLNLYTRDDQQAQTVYEVKLKPPAKPGLFQRIGSALTQSPLIALAIVLVISVVATAVVLINKRPRHDLPPFQRPPVENTQANYVVPRRSRLRVRVVQSPGASRGVEKLVTSFPCVIGRDEKCDICIKDSALSRKHLEIDFRDGHFFVTDRESTNGTFINDTRLRTGAATRVSGVVSVRLGTRTILELDTGD
jgi:hypothetical protein